jgi:DNA-directed RNA polymerase subunit RPC12/RpoP
MTCDYCQNVSADDAAKCENCGAPLLSAENRPAPDYRFCPYCRRRLLALGSPACNYCGRSLPADLLKAREAMLERITQASAGSNEDLAALENETDDDLRRALKSLFDLDEKTRRD